MALPPYSSALLLIAVTGCAPNSGKWEPDAVGYFDPKTLSSVDLCGEYGRVNAIYHQGAGPFLSIPLRYRDEDRAELERRGLISPSHIALIDAEKVTYGMSGCGVRAAWGAPDDISHHQIAGHETQVWFYSHSYRGATLTDGLVTDDYSGSD